MKVLKKVLSLMTLGEYLKKYLNFQDYKALCGKNWDSIEEEKVRRARWEEQYKEMENNNEENARFTEA